MSLEEPEKSALKKMLTTPPVKKIDLHFPLGLEVTARNLKGVTIKDALDAIFKQFRKKVSPNHCLSSPRALHLPNPSFAHLLVFIRVWPSCANVYIHRPMMSSKPRSLQDLNGTPRNHGPVWLSTARRKVHLSPRRRPRRAKRAWKARTFRLFPSENNMLHDVCLSR